MMGSGGREGVGVEGVVGEGGRAVVAVTVSEKPPQRTTHPNVNTLFTGRNAPLFNPPTRLLSARQLESAISF